MESSANRTVSLNPKAIIVVSNVLILSTGGIRSSPSSVDWLIRRQEARKRMKKLSANPMVKTVFLVTNIFYWVRNFTCSQDRYRVVNSLLNQFQDYNARFSFPAL